MRVFLLIFVGFLGLTMTAAGKTESRVIVIPLDPVEQKPSDRMQACVAALHKEGTLSALRSWEELPELPEWVFVESRREIAYIFARPVVSDDYRYAVILGRENELIVVRAGGIAGTYEIFLKPSRSADRHDGGRRGA
jgi:hypothetical protein